MLKQMENLWRSYKSRIVKDLDDAANIQRIVSITYKYIMSVLTYTIS